MHQLTRPKTAPSRPFPVALLRSWYW